MKNVCVHQTHHTIAGRIVSHEQGGETDKRVNRRAFSHRLGHHINECISVVGVHDVGTRSQILKVDLRVALVRLVGSDSIVTIFPAHNLVTPVSNLVAKGLHGQNCEGFLHLCGEFLNTEQKQRDHSSGRDHTNVIPGGFERLVQSQWHEEQPEGQETSCVAVVNKRDRGSQETFTGSQVILKDGQCLVHFILSHKMHGKVFNGHGQVKESTVGSVCGVDNCVRLGLGQSLIKFQSEGGLILPFWRQMALHGTNKGPCADREALEVRLAFLRRDLRAVIKGVTHSDEITGVIDIHSPVLSGLVPSLVGSVCTEDQQETKRSAGKSKGVHGKSEARDVVRVDDGGVVDLVEVVISNSSHVPEKDDGGDGRGGSNLTADVLCEEE